MAVKDFVKLKIRAQKERYAAEAAAGTPHLFHHGALNPGFHSSCTPERLAQLYQAIVAGASLTHAAWVIGITKGTVHHWKTRYPAVDQTIQKAIAERGAYVKSKWLNDWKETHPDGPWPPIDGRTVKKPYVPTRSRAEWSEQEERAAQRNERATHRAKELEQRNQTLKRWKLKNPSILPQLKQMWKQRDAQKQNSPRLNEYVCTVCNRPFATIRKLRVDSAVRCPPCYKFIRAKQKRASYYAHYETRRAQQNDYDRKQPPKIKQKQVVNLEPELIIEPTHEPVKEPVVRPARTGQPVVVWAESVPGV